MAEEAEIMTAYVKMETRGDVAPDVEKQQSKVESLNDQHAQKAEEVSKKQQRMEDMLAKTREKAAAVGGRFGKTKDVYEMQGEGYAAALPPTPPKHQPIESLESKLEASNRQTQIRQDNERAERRRQGLEEAAERKRAAAHVSDREDKTARILNVGAQAQSRSQYIGMAGHAFGGLPFVGGAANIAQTMNAAHQAASAQAISRGASIAQASIAGRAAGIKGGVAAAGVAAVAYGVEGAKKASPQDQEQLEYQADRLQAIVGTAFVPALKEWSSGIQKLGNLIGGKGAQLNMPQFSEFSAMRDRLQLAALQGINGGNQEETWFERNSHRFGLTGIGISLGLRALRNVLNDDD